MVPRRELYPYGQKECVSISVEIGHMTAVKRGASGANSVTPGGQLPGADARSRDVAESRPGLRTNGSPRNC